MWVHGLKLSLPAAEIEKLMLHLMRVSVLKYCYKSTTLSQ